MLNQEEVEKIHANAKKSVLVRCDEYHAHSALSDCLCGPESDITICKLCETIIRLRMNLEKAVGILNGLLGLKR